MQLTNMCCIALRREGDSNPRYALGVYTLSRRASSATRASLLYLYFISFFALCKQIYPHLSKALQRYEKFLISRAFASLLFIPLGNLLLIRKYQYRISIESKLILLFYGYFVGFHHYIIPSKGTLIHEHSAHRHLQF